MWSNRAEAGCQLAHKLLTDASVEQAKRSEMLVLSIPRGGVPIGNIVATTLQCAHDVLIAKKIGFPGMEEMAIGAVTEDGMIMMDRRVNTVCEIKHSELNGQILHARKIVEHYVELFRNNRVLDVSGKFVILVDDGIATGETVKAAIQWLEKHAPKRLVVAVPVIAHDTARTIATLVDELVYLFAPANFAAVGQYYRDFAPLTDEDVIAILKASHERLS